MFELKPLPEASIESALAMVERYRLLNEPQEAESISLDILEVDPGNQKALVALLLSLTDQFGDESGNVLHRARELIGELEEEYARAYYSGIICERRGRAIFRSGTPGMGSTVYDWLRQAMDWYEKAEHLAPDAAQPVIRWNTCARTIDRHEQLHPPSEEPQMPQLLE